MTTFSTIDQFKAAAKFFPKGRIIPQRILKGPRKSKHLFRFGGDAWAIPSPTGYVVAVDSEGGGSAVRIEQPRARLTYPARHCTNMNAHAKTYTLQGSPYVKNGSTRLIGNQLGDQAWLDCLNKAMQEGRE